MGVRAARVALASAPVPADSAAMVEQLEELEALRCQVAAGQLRVMDELRRARIAERVGAGAGQDRWETGIPREVGLALKVSPNRASSLLGTARALRSRLRHTLSRLTAGDLSPEKVAVIVAGLSHLDEPEAVRADRDLCEEAATLAGLGLRRLQDKVRQTAYALDPEGTLARIAAAAKDRRVTVRPVEDGMARVSILLPVAQAVGCYAALRAVASRIAGAGMEPRTLAQIMADTAFARLTGREVVEGQPVSVNLTVSDRVLLGEAAGTAHLDGGGTLPGEVARQLIGRAAEHDLAWLKRLYVTPGSGAVVGMDAKSRCFPKGLASLISARDRYCRTPYCDAPIAHGDHVTGHASGGATSVHNGQGLCRACNYAKEALGWTHDTVADPTGRHTVETTTPSGRRYRSTAPRQERPAAA
ncbi:HNH endonuclease signature motif containing protein [Tsukamurella soli]|uniref:HNH endonuclease signature motif containing protein n=1 Tax=Tsukamurella soli TaxID=644556 RepID=A0ABP8K3I7_9ACTN